MTKVITHDSKYSSNIGEISGVIINYKVDGNYLNLTIKAEEKIIVTYYLSSLDEKVTMLENLQFGKSVHVIGTIHDASCNTIPNTFNYQEYLYQHQIYHIINASRIEFLDNGISFFYQIKNFFQDRIADFSDTSSYLYSFLLGNHGYIDSEVYQEFQNNGVTHLFAVSGMHIGFFTIAIKKLLEKLKLHENIIFVILSMFLFLYSFLVGFSASVVRASLFYIFLTLNKIFHLSFSNLRLLYFLFFLLLILRPWYIYDLGFQYSFATTFGILLFSSRIKGNYLKRLFLVSSIAYLFSLPITIYHFYEFNLLTILNNMIIVPIVSFILFPLSIFTFIFPFLEPILHMGFTILESINTFLNTFHLFLTVPKTSILFLFFYYIILSIAVHRNLKYLFILILLIFGVKLYPYLDSNHYVYFLDIGQGDAALLVTAHHKDIIMIDTGGKVEFKQEDWKRRNSSFSLGDNIVTFFKSIGVAHLDLLAISHGDQDHIGYAKDILWEIRIKNIMINHNQINLAEQYLLEQISNKVNDSYHGKIIQIQNLNDRVVEDENESSLVLFIHLDSKSFLFMGDAPKSVEEDIINRYELDIDVLKVGHHGSKTSSRKDFIDRTHPTYSIISVGRNNRYGHPNKETLENLDNSKIYRTDIDGSIIFKIKNNKLEIETCPP